MNVSDEPAEYPAVPDQISKRSFFRQLRFFGPGAIIASVTIGSGETIFASRGGAVFGYAILWCFVAGAILKGIQVYSGSRFLILTGRHPLESWAEMPGPKGWFVWLLTFLTIIWMPLWLGGGLPKMLGDFTNWAFGLREMLDDKSLLTWARIWATLFIVIGVTLTWFQTYGFLEKIQTTLVGLLLFCMLVAAAFSHPDLVALLKGMFIPSRPTFEPWLLEKYPKAFMDRTPWVEMVVYLGAIGGGTQDYFGYLGLLRAKAWGMLGRSKDISAPAPRSISESPENVARGLRWLRPPAIDASLSFACVLVFTVCFFILGAAMLHPKQEVPAGMDLLVVQHGYLVHPEQSQTVQLLLGFIYKTGIFFAFLGTIWGAYELYTWTMRECLTAAMPRLRNVDIRKFRILTLLYCGIGGLAILWGLDKDPVVIVTPAALVGSALTCGIWCFAMLWSDKVHVPAPLRMRLPLKLLVVVAGAVLCVVPGIGIYQYITRLVS